MFKTIESMAKKKFFGEFLHTLEVSIGQANIQIQELIEQYKTKSHCVKEEVEFRKYLSSVISYNDILEAKIKRMAIMYVDLTDEVFDRLIQMGKGKIRQSDPQPLVMISKLDKFFKFVRTQLQGYEYQDGNLDLDGKADRQSYEQGLQINQNRIDKLLIDLQNQVENFKVYIRELQGVWIFYEMVNRYGAHRAKEMAREIARESKEIKTTYCGNFKERESELAKFCLLLALKNWPEAEYGPFLWKDKIARVSN